MQTAMLTVQLALTRWSRTMSSYYPTFDYAFIPSQFDAPRANEDTMPLIKFARAVDSYIVQVIPSFEISAQASLAIDIAFASLTILVLVFAIITTLISVFQDLDNRFNILNFFVRFFTVIENEFTVPRSLLTILTLLTATLTVSTLTPVLTLKTPLLLYTFLSLVLLVLIIILLWPISLIYNWGTYFTIYIKGESTMSNLLGQVVMDYFYVVSFFLRINLQFLRLIVLSGVFIVYNEFYFEFIYPNYNFEDINFSPRTWDDYAFIGFRFIIVAIFRFIYELGHMWAVLIMQANAFAMILFLILQSLHTVYLAQRLQAYFISKRKKV